VGRIHPLIREFYEHTSRFRLSIIPEWQPWMKPGYEIFKRLVAQPLGQAAIPSNIEDRTPSVDRVLVGGEPNPDELGALTVE
jgi:hypothetical protein